jgi:hypothetical protein
MKRKRRIYREKQDNDGGALLSGILLLMGVVGLMIGGLLDIWF